MVFWLFTLLLFAHLWFQIPPVWHNHLYSTEVFWPGSTSAWICQKFIILLQNVPVCLHITPLCMEKGINTNPYLFFLPIMCPGCLQIWGWKPGFWDSFPTSAACLCHAKAVPPCCSQWESPEGFSAFSELKAGQPGLQLSSRSHRGSTDHAGQWISMVGGQSWKFSHPYSSKKPGNTTQRKPGGPETKLCWTRHIASDFPVPRFR